MGKAEEYRAKKRNKAARKRLSNTVDFTHGIQAAKRRRKAGRRRVCEGMCFSLPTPDDPFNDLYKEKLAKKKGKKDQENGDDNTNLGTKEVSKVEYHGKKLRDRPCKAKGSTLSANNRTKSSGPVAATQRSEDKNSNGFLKKAATDGFSKHSSRNGLKDTSHKESSMTRGRFKWKPSCEWCTKEDGSWMCSSKNAFEVALCALLNANIITNEDIGASELSMKSEMVCMGSKWDWLFWEACGTGSDVIATGRAASKLTIAGGVLAAVAHITARRVHQILSSSPVVLFIVQSKEQTLQVRSIFKFLKPHLGLHSVSLHTGTPLQHQIEGLRSTPVEILVATPDRLCNLLSVNAISLSNISFMVVDGLEAIISCGFIDQLVCIRAKVADNVQSVLSSEDISHRTYTLCQNLLKEPICRVISDTSFPQCSAWIGQSVQVLVSEDKRQQKLLKIVRDHFENCEKGAIPRGLLVLFRLHQSLLKVKAAVQDDGYSAACFVVDSISQNPLTNLVFEQFRVGQVEVLLSTEEYIGQIDLAAIGIVVYYEFPSTMDLYRQTLMRMARRTVKGVLYSFCSGAMAPLALQLVELLGQCSQQVPTSLKMLAEAAMLVEEKKQH